MSDQVAPVPQNNFLPRWYSLLLIILPLFLLAGFLRVYNLDQTGYEVDEIVNFHVPQQINQMGYPTIKPESLEKNNPYLFHPPSLYYFFAEVFRVFGENLLVARVVNVIFSMISLLLLYFMLLRSVGGRKAAFLGLLLLGTDGWLVMTNRMNYIENIQFTFILLGLLLYQQGVQKKETNYWLFFGSGVILGLAISLKLIGGYVLLAIGLNYLLQRKHHLGHLILMIMAVTTLFDVMAYFYYLFGDIFLEQSVLGHFARVTGERTSRGMNFGIWQIVTVIWQRYWIYITTVLAFVIGGIVAAGKFFQQLIRRPQVDTFFLSWCLSGLTLAAVSSLKSPHYLMLWLIPVYLLLAEQLAKFFTGKRLLFLPIFMILILGLNFYTWQNRFLTPRTDVLRAASEYINQNLPADAVVMTEPYVGFLINQNYLREYRDNLTQTQLAKVLAKKKVNYAAFYYSSTVKMSDSKLIWNIYHACQEIKIFEGFKDGIYLCKIPENFDFELAAEGQ